MLPGIPKFFRLALAHMRELEIVPLAPETLSTNSARSHPMFTSPLFRLPPASCVRYGAIWRNVDLMTLNRVQDTFKIDTTDGSVGEYSDGELTRYFYERCRTYGANLIVTDWRSLIPISTMVKNWHAILNSIPGWIVRAARGEDGLVQGMFSKVAQRMMALPQIAGPQGWKGGGETSPGSL